MKDYFNLRKSKLLLFTLLAAFAGGVSPAWADAIFEGFDSSTSNSNGLTAAPTGWSVVGTTSNFTRKTNYYRTAAPSIGYTSTYGSDYLITPEVSGDINFWILCTKESGTYYGKAKVYEYDGSNVGSTLVTDEVSTNKSNSNNQWKEVSFHLDHATKLAIQLNYAYIDDFSATNDGVGGISKPTGLAASSITCNSAELSWTSGSDETAWQVVYSTDASFDKDAAEKTTVLTTSYSLTNLSDNTTYYVAVRAYKSETEQSGWVTTSFTTPLAPITEFPWAENFNSISSGIPTGWDNTEGTTTSASYKWMSYSSGHDGRGLRFDSYNNYTNNTNFLKTPIMNFTTGKNMQLKFWYKNPKGGDFSVYISNDGGATYTTELTTGLTGVTDWTEKEINIPSDFTSNVVIVFKGTSNYGSGDAYIYLDDVSVEEMAAGAYFAIDKNFYDFGAKNVNEIAEQTFTITNSGTADLTVSFTTSEGFSVPNYVVFTDVLNWGNIHMHYWGGATSTTWPGVSMEEIGTNEFSQKKYRAVIPDDATGVIFNNNDNGKQTVNLLYTNSTEGFYTIDELEGNNYKAGSWNNGPGWNVAAGESREFTVKMNTETAGVKNGNITLSYTAVNGTEAIIPVSGTVMPAGAEVVDFNTAIPERWDNEGNGWSIDNGAAKCTGKKNLTTQKLDFSGETSPFFVMKVKASDSGSGDYVTVEGSSDNGATWNAFDKKTYSYPTDFGANTGDYSSIVVSIPNTVNKLRFNGYYVLIDEIAGLKYSDNDPVMGVYTDAECTAANKIATTSVTAGFDFVTADPTPITYYIKNDGTGTMMLSKTDVAGLTVTFDKTSVAAGEKATLTIEMPVANNGGYHGGNVVVTAEDLGTFTVAASGVVVEGGKLNLNFASDAIPSTWTASNWSKDTECITTGYSSSATLTTSALTAVDGEQLVVVAKNTYTGSSYTVGVKYKKAGTEDEFVDLIPAANAGTSYTMLVGTIDEAGEYLLQFNGGYAQIQRIYGLSKPNAPEMVVYDGTTAAGATFSFGKVTDENDTTHEFTVKNEGLAKLTGLAAALSGDDADHYTVAIAGATGDNNDEIEAGAEATITVTQLKDNLGTHSATLTISATGLDSKVIALSGNTVDHTALDVDFDTSSAWPAEILEHDGWSTYYSTYTNDGYASNTSSTFASLILTPLTVANTTDKLTFQAKYYSSSARDLIVRYTTDGGITWNEYECSEEDPKTSFKSQIGYSFSNLEVTNIPAGTVAFDFYGKSIYLDNIAGDMKVTSAPLVSFTTVSDNISDANLKADGTATYTLANKGNADYVATVTLSNVTASVEGEDVAFSENALTIPAGKTAVITVTMAFAAPYGEKTGSMSITSESWVGDINESYTATLVDPTDFVEDFAGNARPAGWYSEGWSYTDGVASVNAGVEKPMITELIGAEDGKNTLKFDAWTTGENQSLNVYTSTDRKNWTLLGDAIALTSESTTYTRTLTNGDQYIKFGGVVAKVDNIKGVKKLEAPAHDLYEISTTMADSGTPGASYTATVTAVSLRADETVIAELWVEKEGNGTKVAYKENEAMTVNTSKTFTLTGNLPLEEGDYEAWVTVKNSDNSCYFNTERIAFTLAHTTSMAVNSLNAVNYSVQADDDNMFTADFTVTLENTGSKTLAANEVSVSITDDHTAEANVYTTKTAAQYVYLYPTDSYTGNNAVIVVWNWSNTTDGEWIATTNMGNGLYIAELKEGKTNFSVVRINPDGTDEDAWNNKWNQSVDLSTSAGNVFTFQSWGEGEGAKDNFSGSAFTLAGGSTLTLPVSVTANAGNGGSFSFNAKENVTGTFYHKNYNVTVNVTAAPKLALNETDNTVSFSEGEKYYEVTLTRPFIAGWNTLVLPFDFAAAQFESATFYAFTENNGGELKFTKVTDETLTAGTPYLVYLTAAISDAKVFSKVTTGAATATDVEQSGAHFIGNYAAGLDMEGKYGVTPAGEVKKGGAGSTMKAFRAYITMPAGQEARVAIFDEATGINRVLTSKEVENLNIFNLKGQKVYENAKGVIIVNGKKQVVK